MLQSEFFDRTKVNLTGEQYNEVEHIYESVQMDKDEFCKLWLKNRDNKIIAELMSTVKKLEDDCQALKADNKQLVDEMEGAIASHKAELKMTSDTARAHIEELGERIIKSIESPNNLYNYIEEEFGISFIIRVKLQNGIELSEEEKNYLIRKL